VSGRVFRDRRSGLVLIVAAFTAVLVALAAAAVATQRSDLASANEAQSREPPTSLGIDPMKGTCPKAEPEKLPPDALAGATESALDQVPSVFGHVIAHADAKTLPSEGVYASSAYLTEGGSASRPGIIRDMCRERPQYGQRLLERSVEVNMIFPEVERVSASLSQHTVYVAKFEGDYWVYAIGH
jgi:hypothetical protein